MAPRSVFSVEQEAFRGRVRDHLVAEVVPEYPTWEYEGKPTARFWKDIAGLGVLGIGAPEEHGGLGDRTSGTLRP